MTSVSALTKELEKHYAPGVVDDIFWWLVLYGVITFDNIDQWNADGAWYYAGSVEYAVFTQRGVVLLNELRTGKAWKQ